MKEPKRFVEPVYVTRPTLPDLESLHSKLEEIWHSGWVTNMGPQHDLFESRVSRYLKAKHLCLFCNGTLALQLGCQALRLSGEVITTPFTFPATTHVLFWNRIQPVFCDIDPETFNIDPEQIESLITPSTTAILPVHVFGRPCDTRRIQEIADRHGLKVIYDAAHAFGVECNGEPISSFGDITMFSFHATKMFHSIEGGALSFSDDRITERLNYAKNFGFKNEETIVVPGINAKMNELQAAVGLLMLDIVEAERERRKALVHRYHERLVAIPGIHFKDADPITRHNYYNMPVVVDTEQYGLSRDELYTALRRYNIYARKYFYPLCSQFQCYRNHPSSSPANLPVSHYISERILILPLYGALRGGDIDRICDVLAHLYQKNAKKSFYLNMMTETAHAPKSGWIPAS